LNTLDGKQWLFIDRQKTGSCSQDPLLPPALTIIENTKIILKQKTKALFCLWISNQKLNAYLKEIADICNK
jgi:hypothetical protein